MGAVRIASVAVVIPWLCCAGFALADPFGGDADGDGVVDLDDFNVLKTNFGMSAGATAAQGDFDADGDVDLDDFMILKANFGLTAPSAPTPEVRDLALAQPSDGVFLTGEGNDGEDLTIQHYTDDYCLATSNTTYDLYISTDAANWTRRAAPTNVDFTCVWGLPNGSILATGNTGPLDKRLFLSTDNGDSWTLCIDCYGAGGSGPQFSQYGYLRAWSVAWTPDGATVVAAEYGSCWLGGGRRIFLSRDSGLTWTQVREQTDEFYHHHACGWHAGQQRFIIACGDALRYHKVMTAEVTSESVTFTDLIPAGAGYIQPTWFTDYGHLTRIAFGADSAAQVGWLDVVTGEYDSVCDRLAYSNGNEYVFRLAHHQDVWYACSMSSADNVPVILVAADLQGPWTVYHRFYGYCGGLQFGGQWSGQLHFSIDDPEGDGTHFAISPAELAAAAAVRVDPVSDTVCSPATATLDGYDSSDLSRSYGSTLTLDTTDPLHGEDSVIWTLPGTEGHGVMRIHHRTACGVAVTPGTTYTLSVAVRGTVRQLTGFWQTNRGTIYSDPGRVQFVASPDRWRTITLRPFTPRAADDPTIGDPAETEAFFYFCAPNEANPHELVIDCVQAEAGPPTGWQDGVTAREARSFDVVHPVGSQWTHIFAWAPSFSHHIGEGFEAGAGPWFIRSWLVSADTYAELYFQPSSADDRAFTWRITTDGGSSYTTLSSSTDQTYNNECPIYFALRYSDNGGSRVFDAFICNGGPVEKIADLTPVDGFSATDIRVQSGDAAASRQFPGWLIESGMYEFRSDAQVEQLMAEIGTD